MEKNINELKSQLSEMIAYRTDQYQDTENDVQKLGNIVSTLALIEKAEGIAEIKTHLIIDCIDSGFIYCNHILDRGNHEQLLKYQYIIDDFYTHASQLTERLNGK